MDDLISASLRRLRAFLVVCDTLHIGRAATQLGIAQPALSQQIRGLETALGVQLFHRRKRGIDLTAAGIAYRDEAMKLIASHAAAAEIARRTARGEIGALSIGYVASAMFDGEFPRLLGALREKHPDIAISLREGGIGDIGRAVSAGEIDIALLRAPLLLPPGCIFRVAVRDRLVVALSDRHRYAARTSLSLGDLADEPMIGFNDTSELGIERVIGDLAGDAGIMPRIEWHVSTMTSLLGLAAAGLGYGIVPEGVSRISLPGVCFRPLDQPVWAELWYVWRKENLSPALKSLAALMPQR
jgi:DNA-binding transcriptional LysR family regulator